MFSQSDEIEGRVRPIRFKPIDGDDQNHSNQWKRRSKRGSNNNNNERCSSERPSEMMTNEDDDRLNSSRDNSLKTKLPPRQNFSLEYSYPAVILEDVCFSVDKSQQQSNFLNECLARLSQCMNTGGQHEDDQKVQILKSVNLSVPHGSIFGLLGPSSCGKTTLLRCLVGLLKPNSGSIRLFGSSSFRKLAADAGAGKTTGCCSSGGEAPDSGRNDCKVPGSNVGYMPQDLGLYEDFTIAQLLTMFGNYMRMDTELIKARIKFMADFLELPHVDRDIQTLSGGQKRRVSFAIACLHMPPLIILDEPTVGVDPLLRRSIWKYLRRLASEENKTIIITTHYIEEAAQADQVALMRAGEILVQDSPSRIIKSNNSRTLEEAFLKICNHVQSDTESPTSNGNNHKLKIIAQPKFHWPAELDNMNGECCPSKQLGEALGHQQDGNTTEEDSVIRELKLKAQQKLAIYDKLRCNQPERSNDLVQGTEDGGHHINHEQPSRQQVSTTSTGDNLCCLVPDGQKLRGRQPRLVNQILELDTNFNDGEGGKTKRGLGLFRKNKFVLNETSSTRSCQTAPSSHHQPKKLSLSPEELHADNWHQQISKGLLVFWALLYKNYRRNVNSIPLLAFQFMLPMIQMISFSLCVGGKPMNVGLGIVNHDNPISFLAAPDLIDPIPSNLTTGLFPEEAGSLLANDLYLNEQNDSLSLRYLSFIDTSMLNVKLYDDLSEALSDVRRAKLWAVLEIGENFTVSIAKRFDLENFYQLDLPTIHQSVIKLYPDRSNKILDMICHRSLVDSYRKFLSEEFEHFKRLPIEIARPIFDIKPNVISNSIDGYTESIAPGLLASLTYIMAAGLTTFIMVVERSAGILERTYTSGINPVAYLLAHALFRSMVMMIQIGFVLALTFYVLKQPLVGSIWLAYFMLMILNVTGIAYGLLISSIVTDQNGAALTIVSSLVVKITLSGILWPFEAIPRWLRVICYIQPLTMPVQALKAITLKGATFGDRAVNLGFLVSVSWLIVFITISAKRFKFYQH